MDKHLSLLHLLEMTLEITLQLENWENWENRK
jgi:hypothetical protein